MQHNSQLYLLSILPPTLLAAHIRHLQLDFSRNFRCYAALKPPVHLTLQSLVRLPNTLTPEQVHRLATWFSYQPSFSLELSNYSFFENPLRPVVFIDAPKNPAIGMLNKGIGRLIRELPLLEQVPNHSFHPHYTIGYRDIPPAIFPEVKAYYSTQTFSAIFPVWEVCLHRHNGNKWVWEQSFPLGLNSATQSTLWL